MYFCLRERTDIVEVASGLQKNHSCTVCQDAVVFWDGTTVQCVIRGSLLSPLYANNLSLCDKAANFTALAEGKTLAVGIVWSWF